VSDIINTLETYEKSKEYTFLTLLFFLITLTHLGQLRSCWYSQTTKTHQGSHLHTARTRIRYHQLSAALTPFRIARPKWTESTCKTPRLHSLLTFWHVDIKYYSRLPACKEISCIPAVQIIFITLLLPQCWSLSFCHPQPHKYLWLQTVIQCILL
jgi:hypothetical protein